MKREILFRGKRVDNGEWVEGELLFEIHNRVKIETPSIHFQVGNDLNGAFIRVGPETVGQFTGLTDKNGVKIFEGDWIRCGYTAFIEWDINDCCFVSVYSHPEDPERLLLSNLGEIEVIGNIHDNK